MPAGDDSQQSGSVRPNIDQHVGALSPTKRRAKRRAAPQAGASGVSRLGDGSCSAPTYRLFIPVAPRQLTQTRFWNSLKLDHFFRGPFGGPPAR